MGGRTIQSQMVEWFNEEATVPELKLLYPILRDIYKRRTAEEDRAGAIPAKKAAPKKRHRRTNAEIEAAKKATGTAGTAGTAGSAAFDG